VSGEKNSLMYMDPEGERLPTWNPHPGCGFDCTYCYGPRTYARSKCPKCKTYKPHFHEERMKQTFKKGKTYFVESLGDPSFIPPDIFQQILDHLAKFPETQFMLQSRNPIYFLDFEYPENVWLGTTFETNYDNLAEIYSKAPVPSIRANGLWLVKHEQQKNEIYFTVEPAMVFDYLKMMRIVEFLKPAKIYIGRDNHGNNLPEPSEADLMYLVTELEEKLGKEHIHRKTLGQAWWEK